MTEPAEPTPFITPQDELYAGGRKPRVIGQQKLNDLKFSMDNTDEEIDAIAARVKEIRDTYEAWQAFYEDLELRKKRQLGFQAVAGALDLTEAAKIMGTTPDLVAAVMHGNVANEAARIAELEAMWQRGELPDRPVLSDPSKDIVAEGDQKLTGTGS